jgi:hypothetical protein
MAWLGLPFGILWLAQPHHMFIPRYVLFMQPVYLLVGAYGLTQVARTLTAAVATLVPLARPTSSLGPLVCGALLAAVAAITFTPTWHSYWVEKINDWSAICAYLRKNVKPGDVMTGNAYTQGIIAWCFQRTTDVSFAPPGSYALAELDGSGRNVWYVLVGSSSPDAAFVRRHYAAVPRGAWARRDLIPVTSYGDRLIFPQAEFAATLYHYTATRIPRQIRFHDVHGAAINPSWPDYAQIGPGGRYDVRLALRATAPRVLRIVMFRLAGRDLNVLLDRVLAARIRPHTTSAGWVAVEIPVPRHVGDAFLLELQNPSANVSAFSEVEVDYACASAQSARQHVAGAPPGRTGLTPCPRRPRHPGRGRPPDAAVR